MKRKLSLPHIDYSMLPDGMREATRLYVEEGICPGGFLTAVLENNFVHAVTSADRTNKENLKTWAIWLYNEAPAACWGNSEEVNKWIKLGGLRGYLEDQDG